MKKIFCIFCVTVALGLVLLPAMPVNADVTPNEPAVLRIIRLVIEPAEARIGQAVTIRALMDKTGDEAIMYRVTLSVNNVAAETQEIYFFQTYY